MKRTPLALFALLAACTKATPPKPDDTGRSIDDSTDDRPPNTDDTATSTDDSPPDGDSVTVEIGPAGGRVDHPGGASVEIPAGALIEATNITIRLMEESELAAPDADDTVTGLWDFGPDGATFATPVTVTLPLTAPLADDDDALLGYYDEADAAWYLLMAEDPDNEHVGFAQVLDRDAMTLSAPTNHFTAIAGTSNALVGPYTYTSGDFSFEAYDVRCSWTPRERRHRSGTVDAVVVHSTASKVEHNSTQAGACWMASQSNSAQFMIGRDGRIVHLWDPHDYDVAHVAAKVDCTDGSPTTYPTSLGVRTFTSGIELQNSEPNFSQRYSGAQMASLLQLVDYHLDRFNMDRPTFPRPINTRSSSIAVDNTWNAHGAVSVVYHRELDGCRTAGFCKGDAHLDPSGEFRFEAFERALARDFGGEIDVSGGDAYGDFAPGNAGAILIEEDITVAVSRKQRDLIVPSGTSESRNGTQSYDDVIIEGTLTLTADTTLEVFGTLFIAEGGRIEGAGHDLTIVAGGLVLIDGRIDLSGPDGYIPDDATYDSGGSWTACYYDVTGAEGPGGDGGDFTLRVKTGPIFVPTLLAMGGDAYEWDPDIETIRGGDGGDIAVSAMDAHVYLRGDEPRPLAFVLATQSKTMAPKGCDLTGHAFGMIQPKDNLARRGIISSGGAGPRSIHSGTSADLRGMGGEGGKGGDVNLLIMGGGKLHFDAVDIWTGGGFNSVTSSPFMRDLYAVAAFEMPLGGMGGRGNAGYTADGGDGGMGGAAGTVTISGANNLGTTTSTQPFTAFDNDNPNSIYPGTSGSTVVGEMQIFESTGEPQLRILAAGGTGGSPGGTSATAFPGWFGFAGGEGTVSGP